MNMQKGFSLIELAMVLLIISLLLGGLLVPLATQLEGRQRGDAEQQLERIREALIGFAIVNGRLPCYTTVTDPASVNYGVEESVATTGFACNPGGQLVDGILPWKTLGLNTGRDPWGVERTASTDPWLGYWRYRVHAQFYATFSLTSDPTSSNRLCVEDASNNLLVSTSETAVAIVYSTGADRAADGENATYEATATTSTDCVTNTPILYQGGPVSGDFDDITMWLTRPLLFNRMVTVGRLP